MVVVVEEIQDLRIRVFKSNQNLFNYNEATPDYRGVFMFRVKNEIKRISLRDIYGGVSESTEFTNNNDVIAFMPKEFISSKQNLEAVTHASVLKTELFDVDTVPTLANHISTYLLSTFQFTMRTLNDPKKPMIVIVIDVDMLRVVDDADEGIVDFSHNRCESKEDEDKEIEDSDTEKIAIMSTTEDKEIEDSDTEKIDNMSVDEDEDEETEDSDTEKINIMSTLRDFFDRNDVPSGTHDPEELENIEVAMEFDKLEEGCEPLDSCPICMEEMAAGMMIARMPCSHVFHMDCAFKWLPKSNTCPLCRSLCATLI